MNQWLIAIRDFRINSRKPKPEGFSSVAEIAAELQVKPDTARHYAAKLWKAGRADRDWFTKSTNKEYCYRLK